MWIFRLFYICLQSVHLLWKDQQSSLMFGQNIVYWFKLNVIKFTDCSLLTVRENWETFCDWRVLNAYIWRNKRGILIKKARKNYHISYIYHVYCTQKKLIATSLSLKNLASVLINLQQLSLIKLFIHCCMKRWTILVIFNSAISYFYCVWL